jgi:hypothetical protein
MEREDGMGKVVVPVRTRMVTSTLAHANGYPPPLFGHRCPASGGIYDGDAGGTAMDWQDIPLILNHHYVNYCRRYQVSATTGTPSDVVAKQAREVGRHLGATHVRERMPSDGAPLRPADQRSAPPANPRMSVICSSRRLSR